MGGQVTAISSGEACCQQSLDFIRLGRSMCVSFQQNSSGQHTHLVHGAGTACVNAFSVVMYKNTFLESSMLIQHQHLWT